MNEYRPSALLYAPTFRDGMLTLAPCSGVSVSVVTRPVIVMPCWARAWLGASPTKNPAATRESLTWFLMGCCDLSVVKGASEE
jgi:hypothetical protein